MSRGHTPLIVTILAAILFMFGAYMGTYYVMLEGIYTSGEWRDPQGEYLPLPPTYRVQHPAVEVLFWPAYQVDRRIRFNTLHIRRDGRPM